MKRPDLPYLEFHKRGAKTYIYFVKGKFRRRLPDDPNTEEFSVEYWATRNGNRNRPAKTTWRKLVASYYASPGFQRKAKGTKANYRRHCEAICEKNGDKDVRQFRRKHAIAVRDALQDQWSKANERIAVLSILCKHAVDLEWIDRNPVVDIEKLTGGEYEPWPDWALRAFERAAEPGTLARTAFEMLHGSGQRIGDCCAMRWADYDGEFITVKQQKTGEPLDVACPPRLRAYLDALPRAGEHILAKNLRRPIGKRQAQKAIEDVRAQIGAEAFVPHGLRYNAATELYDAGCSTEDVMAVTGHRSEQMARKYGKRADRKARSKRAQEKRGRT